MNAQKKKYSDDPKRAESKSKNPIAKLCKWIGFRLKLIKIKKNSHEDDRLKNNKVDKPIPSPKKTKKVTIKKDLKR